MKSQRPSPRCLLQPGLWQERNQVQRQQQQDETTQEKLRHDTKLLMSCCFSASGRHPSLLPLQAYRTGVRTEREDQSSVLIPLRRAPSRTLDVPGVPVISSTECSQKMRYIAVRGSLARIAVGACPVSIPLLHYSMPPKIPW